MRRVHWSVWGFVGFFSMMLLGLWVDSRWLLGVGAKPQFSNGVAAVPTTAVPAVVPVSREVEPDATPPDSVEVIQAEPTRRTKAPQVTVGLSAPGVSGWGGLDIPEMPHLELLPPPETTAAAAIEEPLDTTGCTFMRLAIPVGPIEVSIPATESEAGDPTTPEPSPTQRILKRDEQPTHATEEPAEVDDPHGSMSALREALERYSSVLRSPAFAPDEESKDAIIRGATQVFRQQQEAEREAALLDPPPPLRPPGDFASPPPPPEPAPSASPEQVEALRAAAQHMDELANHLERHNLYPRADQMRGMAQEMRMDARKGTPRLPAPGPTP